MMREFEVIKMWNYKIHIYEWCLVRHSYPGQNRHHIEVLRRFGPAA